MAFSIQRTTSDGTLALLDISIEYFDRTEIAVLFDDIVDALPWAWVGVDDNQISFTPAVPDGVEVSVRRTTDISKARHEFSLGAAFTAGSLDEDIKQVLHIAQEAKEGSGLGEIFQNLNYHGYRAINLGDGVDPQDAATVAQMTVHDADMAAYVAAAAASAVLAQNWAIKTDGPVSGGEFSAKKHAQDAAASAASAAGAVSAHVAEVDPHTQYVRESTVDQPGGVQSTLVSGTNIKTLNGNSILGSGDLALAGSAHGQCRLTKSGANLLLSPFNGNKLIINGTVQTIPSGGVTLTAPATSGTTYFIYAYMNGATMTLEASTTGHATDSTTGVEVKSGDATRTLVGMARTVSSAWVDSQTQRFVISWFNRQRMSAQRSLTSSTSTTSATFVELSSSERAEFLCWSESVHYNITGAASLNSGSNMQTVIWRDGAALTPGIGVSFGSAVGGQWPAVADSTVNEGEGYHYGSFGAAVSGSATWTGGGYSKISVEFSG